MQTLITEHDVGLDGEALRQLDATPRRWDWAARAVTRRTSKPGLWSTPEYLPLGQTMSLILTGKDHELSALEDSLLDKPHLALAGTSDYRLLADMILGEYNNTSWTDWPDDVRGVQQPATGIGFERDENGRVTSHVAALRVLPDLDLLRSQHVGCVPHRVEEQLGVDAGGAKWFRFDLERLILMGVLRDHPSVVLELKAALLHGAHPLRGHHETETDEVVVLKLVGIIEVIEKNLDSTKLFVEYLEEQLDPVVGDVVRADDSVKVLFNA